ncbi:hypothetical protein HUW46_09417 [Amycolatopsis sp. CA-230715]|nr:hypothetical protein HUW46_09417 [Amycolatopsis sp. CA-230715]
MGLVFLALVLIVLAITASGHVWGTAGSGPPSSATANGFADPLCPESDMDSRFIGHYREGLGGVNSSRTEGSSRSTIRRSGRGSVSACDHVAGRRKYVSALRR